MPTASIILAIVLSGCVPVSENGKPFAVMASDGGKGCRTVINGRTVDLDELLSLGKTARRTTDRAIVRAQGDTPYRCIGGAIYTLQRAGFVRVDFQSSAAKR